MKSKLATAVPRAAGAALVSVLLTVGPTADRARAQAYMNDGSSVYMDSWADDSLIYGYGATSGSMSFHWYQVNVTITSPLGRTATGTSGQYVPGFVQGNAMITWSYDDWGEYLVRTTHGGFCTWSYVYFVLAEMQRRQRAPCPVPSGETTSSAGWADEEGRPAVHKFIQQLSPGGTRFGGRIISESDSSPATDSCWFPESRCPPTRGVTGGSWIVGSDNRWGPDYVGWETGCFSYYQRERRRQGLPPCEFNLFQRLTISECGFGSSPTVYRTNVVLKGIVSATGASSGRDGVLVGRPLIIE
ncbi:MAG TPA: hypothetical protein VNJ11_01145 [Bryobacteraceae bacterium]|nr:hypothetical protein [Bryobacteraceae bacterium]